MLKGRQIDPNAKIAIDITAKGYYELENERIDLIHRAHSEFTDVEVFDFEKLSTIVNDVDDFFDCTFSAPENCSFYLVDADSFQAAAGLLNPLVMNFANARHPGGGFLSGARAQEESLCRCSTLFASISSDKAREMYQFNKEHPSPTDSDYMLLSPDVCVFRDIDGSFLDKPFSVSVWTIPAPDKWGRASDVPQSELDAIMKERLRLFLMAAARRGYRNLVLGAWGCGAFGHDAKTVASYFNELFFEEDFQSFFETVVFAILNGPDKVKAFSDVFGDRVENCCDHVNEHTSSGGFFEATVKAPYCNHIFMIERCNLGYSQGIFSDGTPFEAELWADGQDQVVQFILPEMDFSEDEVEPLTNGKVSGFRMEAEQMDASALVKGMVDRGYCNDISTVEPYLQYLESMGVLSFLGSMRNGCLHYLQDLERNRLAGVIISLTINGAPSAQTTLHFRNFPSHSKPKLTLI